MAYSEKQIENIFESICTEIERGRPLRQILNEKKMPSSKTFFEWLEEDEIKVKRYARACQLRADMIFDEIFEIADNTIEGIVIETDDHGRTKEKKGDMLGHRRLQIDARKWVLSKMNPKKYGEKIGIDHESPDGSMSPKPNIIVNSEKAAKEIDKLLNE